MLRLLILIMCFLFSSSVFSYAGQFGAPGSEGLKVGLRSSINSKDVGQSPTFSPEPHVPIACLSVEHMPHLPLF